MAPVGGRGQHHCGGGVQGGGGGISKREDICCEDVTLTFKEIIIIISIIIIILAWTNTSEHLLRYQLRTKISLQKTKNVIPKRRPPEREQ